MAFQSNVPIIGAGFQNRSEELQRLDQVARRLANGEPSWLAILGPRKVGKTSLVLEFARRHASKLHVVSFDVSQWSPVSWEVFRNLALRAIDELAGASTGVSFEALADDRDAWRETVSGTELFARLPPRARSTLVALPELAGPELARRSLELPELVAEVMDRPLVVAVDEFQELAQLGAGRKGVDPFPIVRAVWQHHRRVAYVVSGSEQSMMLEMVSSKASPFFQHFSVLELGVFDEEHAVRLLTEGSPADRPIPRSLAERAVQTLGTHPFYLQMLGEALVASPPPYDDHDLKAAIQELVFARAGRLSLFFGRQWDGLVGRSTTLAATLEALSLGNTRVKDVASAVGTTQEPRCATSNGWETRFAVTTMAAGASPIPCSRSGSRGADPAAVSFQCRCWARRASGRQQNTWRASASTSSTSRAARVAPSICWPRVGTTCSQSR